jgi:RecJ-like exonuclease
MVIVLMQRRARPGNHNASCPVCDGLGYVTAAEPDACADWMTAHAIEPAFEYTCPECCGSGKVQAQERTL